LGLRYRPYDWLQLTAGIPYKDIAAKEVFIDSRPVGGTFETRRSVFRYNDDGLGDITLMGWLDLLYPFTHGERIETTAVSDVEYVEEEHSPEGVGDPFFYLGLGVKLDTGVHDERSIAKYNYDRKGPFGDLTSVERSVADGVVPAAYQTGTGTTDLLASLVYQQQFGHWIPVASLSYQMTGGDNSVGYEFSDKFSWSAGTKYVISQTPDCRQFYVNGAISGLLNMDPDKDHSENTKLLGSQKVGDVPQTEGTYNFYGFGVGYDITTSIRVNASFTLPLGTHNSDSDNSFDRQIGVGVQYRF
jgi:hypothetical protein